MSGQLSFKSIDEAIIHTVGSRDRAVLIKRLDLPDEYSIALVLTEQHKIHAILWLPKPAWGRQICLHVNQTQFPLRSVDWHSRSNTAIISPPVPKHTDATSVRALVYVNVWLDSTLTLEHSEIAQRVAEKMR